MSDSLVICRSCGESVRAEEYTPGVSLVCEDCEPPASGEKDPPDRVVSTEEDQWHELEMRRWWFSRRKRG